MLLLLRYIIATQDRELQDKLRLIPGVALFYFHNKGPTLEAPTEVSEKAASATANARSVFFCLNQTCCSLGENSFGLFACFFFRWGINKYEEETLSKLKEAEGIKPEEKSTKKKKKKQHNPNPLSCKRKKKKSEGGPEVPIDSKAGVKKKRSRRGKKIPQHVKAELLRLKSDASTSV